MATEKESGWIWLGEDGPLGQTFSILQSLRTGSAQVAGMEPQVGSAGHVGSEADVELGGRIP